MRGIAQAANRGAVVGAAYLATALATIAVIFVMRRLGAVDRLAQVLGVQFIATLAAGLEPATSRALAIARGGALAQETSARPIVIASAAKAMLAAVGLAAVWRIADPRADLALLVFSPLLCLAGFVATDLRVLLDLQGRHALAIWLKQGSLAFGLLVLAVLTLAGVTLPAALGAAVATRLALTAIMTRGLAAPAGGGAWREAGRLLSDPRWLHLAGASVLGAAGGAADRVFGLRFLGPAAWSSYYLVYEVFSKAWFVPYLVAPILFARAAGGRDGGLSPRLAWSLTAVSGVGLVACLLGAFIVAPGLAARLIGADIPPAAVVAFAVAVSINSLVQLRVVEFQGSGQVRRALAITGLTALCAVIVFYLAASRGYGAAGLLYAWLIKALIELALAFTPVPRPSGDAVRS